MRYIFLFLLIGTLHAQNLHQVNVPTAIGGSPHPSSLLTLNSTDKGFLIPRMTTSQRTNIPTPATGLMVYDTDLNQIQVFNGTWGSLGGGSVAGSNGQVQFNNNGAFGASSRLNIVNPLQSDGYLQSTYTNGIQSPIFQVPSWNSMLRHNELVLYGSASLKGSLQGHFYTTSGNFSIGTDQTTQSRLNVRGSGTANGTDALLVEASDGTDLFEVENGGLISVGKNVGGSGTQSTATIRVISGDTNTGLALVPKGSGAITAAVPDGAAAGGNARGANAVDLQTKRTTNAQVASGESSVLSGGENNIASAAHSVVPGGRGARAILRGQRSVSAGEFSVIGDNQRSDLSFRNISNGTTQIELFLNGSSERAQLSLDGTTNARVWNARIQCVAIVTSQGNGSVAAGLTHSETFDIVIKRTASGTSIVGSSPLGVIRVSEMSTASFAVDADAGNNALRIRFTPPSGAGSTTTIRAAATAYLTELGY